MAASLPMPQEHIAWLSQITRADEPMVGAKAADLGEMTRMGLPVPNGFAVGVTAYYSFLQLTGLRTKLEALLADLDTFDSQRVQTVAKQAQAILLKTKMPDSIQRGITDAYHHLSAKEVFVAVRTSVPDAQAMEIALSQQAKLNVIGAKAVIEQVQMAWAGLFSAKAIHARGEQGLGQLGGGLAVIVQRMVESESSGILFTLDPMAQGQSTISIEAAWGLGEPIMTGDITPDHYEVNRADWTITRRDIVRQEWQLTRREGKPKSDVDHNLKVPVSAAWQRKQKLSDQQIVSLAKLAVKVEEHYGYPQDCEWAFADQTFYLVQTRAVPALDLGSSAPASPLLPSSGHEPVALLKGLAAAPGLATGPVRLIRSIQDLAKVKAGDIAVCQTTTPDYDQALNRAAAVVTMTGSLASHAAAMSRQLGIPAVVEVGDIAGLLQAGETVTVDGDQGAVFAGTVHIAAGKIVVSSASANATRAHPELGVLATSASAISTATKIMVSVSEPTTAEDLAQKPVDGVGLLRAEYMLSSLGEHPQYLLQKDKGEVVISALYDGLMAVAKAFHPRPVVYRVCDFTSREYARLHGGEQFELIENNPMLGYRGAYRYVTEPEMFKLELAAIRKARAYYKNIWLMVPFIRRPQELVQVKQLLAEEGLYRSGSFKLQMTIEVPSTVFLLDQFLGVGIDGISVDAHDLTQLLLGIDRDNPRVAPLFDETHEAVLMALEQVLKAAARHGVTASVYGQAVSLDAELAGKLVAWGVSSLTVSPESAEATRRLVAEAELAAVRRARSQPKTD
jgi:pyruvate,water dikinase